VLERSPPPDCPDAGKQRRRRGVRSRSAARVRRGDYFYKREITRNIRSRLVTLGMIREGETDDRAAVIEALNAIIDEVLHLRK
jgi:hypothetical protein